VVAHLRNLEPQNTLLSLANNYLTGEDYDDMSAVIELAEAFTKMPSLREVNLARNNLTKYGRDMSAVIKLAEVIPSTHISSLNLQNNHLNDAAKQQLREDAPRVQFEF